jgi:LmbE family N-acetylglucosaminyl deacetylase|tara:strand:+ start:118 stop:804 length:687 start_codon:yes stop_codon:yes gene_type:complete
VKNNNILIIAAHPDDEVLGCGGTVAKMSKNGDNVDVLIISDGVSSRNLKNKVLKENLILRRQACVLSCDLLGINKPEFENFPDNQLDKIPLLKITQVIEKKIKKIKPNIIFTHHWGDLNVDHQKISKAVITACRPQKGNNVKTLLFFEIPSSTEWQISSKKNLFSPNWFFDISSTINLKIKALKFYKSELKKSPHPRSLTGIKTLAKWRGAVVGSKAAEAFELGRKYE